MADVETRDEWLHEQLGELGPPPRPGFRQDLWRRIESHQLGLMRRWRAAAIIATAVAIAATTAAGVLAFGSGSQLVIDESFSCTTEEIGGEFSVTAGVAVWTHRSAGEVSTGNAVLYHLLDFGRDEHLHPLKNKVKVDPSHCQKTTRRIPLDTAGLRPHGTAKAPRSGRYPWGSVGVSCLIGASFLVRVRVAFNAAGDPTTVALAIRRASGKPLGFLQIRPPNASSYASPTCQAP